MKIQGKLVSKPWGYVLREAIHDGVAFQLNSGRRTMAQQRALVAEKGVWSLSNQTGAAYPSATAPHIRVGRPDHALDVDTAAQNGGNARLSTWLGRHGVPVDHEIAAEPWHIEARSAVALVRFAVKCRRAQAKRARAAKRRKKR